MIGYVMVGTNDLEKAAAFYDELFVVLGAKRMMEQEKTVVWSVSPDKPFFAAIKPFDGKAATVGNGTMIALACENPEMVDALHKKALELGAKDEGPAGPRGETFYCGYFRDLDGNKFNAFSMT